MATKKDLTFTQNQTGGYSASFNATSDFKLHLEFDKPSLVSISQKDPDGNTFVGVASFDSRLAIDTSFGDPFKAYPVTIRIDCSNEPIDDVSFYKLY